MNARGAGRGVWTGPILVSAASVVGLVAALIGDGWWDGVSWLTLSIPVAVSASSLWRARAGRQAARRATNKPARRPR